MPKSNAMEIDMNSAAIDVKQTCAQSNPTARLAARLGGGLLLLALLGACSGGVGGLSAYQGDSSYGCRATATKTVCPR